MSSYSISHLRKGRQRGASLVMFTFITFLVVVPVIGLAVDGSIVMWQKARLSAAIDSAALAAGRSLSVGQTLSAQALSARTTARSYFDANFIPGAMGSSVSSWNANVHMGQTLGTRLVTIDATAIIPLYFLQTLGFPSASLAGHGESSRRDVNVILVLDRSGSMAASRSCSPMLNDAKNFSDLFVNGRDSLQLITFQTTANLDWPASPLDQTTNFKPGLSQTLDRLVCSGHTNSAWALSLALAQLQPNALNVVVFFSDGYPTSVRYANQNTIPVRNQPADNKDLRYDPIQTSKEGPVPTSGCLLPALSGILTIPGQNPDPIGQTWGVLKDSTYDIASSEGSAFDLAHLVPAPGCSFTKYGVDYMRDDIAYLPTKDGNGNPTNAPLSGKPFKIDRPLVLFPSNGAYHYPGKIRPDVPQNLVNTAFITADNAAYTLRYSPYTTMIYSIGLGPQVDDDFMKRVANDPSGSSYDSRKPAGSYIWAPNSGALASAFQQIASQILRISQ